MKIKLKQELHAKTIEELKKTFQEVKKELDALQLEFSQGKLKNISSLFHKRKDMARVQTILRGKELTK